MKRYQYKVNLLSDIIISSVTATEGFNPSLDYIPGAKFLGIAASSLYKENNPSTLDIFHNGHVRFGDATPIISSEVAYPVPFSWFYEKGKGLHEPPIYLHHYLENIDFNHLTLEGKQLKQARNGYFTESGKYLKIDQEFAIRSKYNRAELRADDGKMFGYFSLPQGSQWSFIVEDDTEQYADEIKATLIGRKRIGRSRSAEYGLIEINFDKEISAVYESIPESQYTLIYAMSNLCFYDDYGRPTVLPEPIHFGILDGEVIWHKSQIRTRLYQTWNRKRHNRDSDRWIIEKGSVLAIKHKQTIDSEIFSRGVGSHKSEGFGKVLVNPNFLLSSSKLLDLNLTNISYDQLTPSVNQKKEIATSQDKLVVDFLESRGSKKTNAFAMDKSINDFIRIHGGSFDGLSPSQWGTIRAYAKHFSKWEQLDNLLFHKDFGALHRGKSESIWRRKNRRGILESFLNKEIQERDRVSFTLKLAAEMAKRKTHKEVL